MNLQFTPDLARDETKISCLHLNRSELYGLGAEWHALSDSVIEENAYFHPAYARALLDHIDTNPAIKAVAAYSHEQQLTGLLPYVQNRWRWGGLAPVNVTWMTPYTFSGMPLIAKQAPEQTWVSMIEAMASQRYWLLPTLNLDGPVARGLKRALQDAGLQFCEMDVFERAALIAEGDFESHLKNAVSASRRKSLRRYERKLIELGKLEFDRYTRGIELDAAVEVFMRIEACGWKGKKGTALSCHDNTAAFARQAFGAGSGISCADVLSLDEKPIAVSLMLQTGRCAFSPKAAYDEAYRNYSAGLVLDKHIMESFFAGGWANKIDSSAQRGHVLEDMWNDTIRVGDLLICCDAQTSQSQFARALRYEQIYRYGRGKLKSAYARLRDH